MFAFALLVAAVVLLNLVSGAVLTNALALGTANADGVSIFSLLGHRHVSEAAAGMAVVLIAWALLTDKRGKMKVASGLALVCLVGEASLGLAGAPLSPFVGFLHALLAQLLFACLVAMAVFLWSGWEKEPIAIPDKGWPSVRSLANITVLALITQVALGAAFRHNLLGVLWHILCAFVVVVFGLALLVIITQVPENRSLRPPVIWLGILLGIQISLGMVLISISQPAKHAGVSAFSVAAHVLVGASALGVGVMTAMLVRRSVKAIAPEEAAG